MAEKKEKLTLKTMRHLLGSIDLSDIEDEEKEESEAERRAYCAAIFAVWPRLEKDLKKMMHTQLMFSSNQSEDWFQTILGRGTFNGLSLPFEKWRMAQAEHIANSKDKKEEEEE